MKLSKAIEIIEFNLKEVGNKMPADVREALELGIEALERLNDWRSGVVLNPDFMLQSETE